MVEHPEKQYDVKALAQLTHVVNRDVAKLDIETAYLGGKARLAQIVVIGVDSEHARGSAAFHLDRIKSGVAADVEYRAPLDLRQDRRSKPAPLDGRIVAEKMRGSGFYSTELEVVKPWSKLFDLRSDIVTREIPLAHHVRASSLTSDERWLDRLRSVKKGSPARADALCTSSSRLIAAR